MEQIAAALQALVDALAEMIGRILDAVREFAESVAAMLRELELRSNGHITNGEIYRSWGYSPLGWLARFAEWRTRMWLRIAG